ncbi:13063_t:CDS:2, partial [Racocetra persica]
STPKSETEPMKLLEREGRNLPGESQQKEEDMFVFKWIKGLLCSMFSFRTREEYLNYVKENLPKKEPLPENINKAIDDLYDISKNELNVLLETPSIDEEWLTKLATAENSILLQYKEKNIEFINLVEK